MIAISVVEKNIDTKIEECFGKCHYLCLIDKNKKKFSFIRNPGFGARRISGRVAANYLIKNGVKTVISSNFGTSVKRFFDRHKIQIVILSDDYKNLKDIDYINEFEQI